MIITISNFRFDSLTNWNFVYDITEMHPYLTMQQARLATNFHRFHDIGMKASTLFNLVNAMTKNHEHLSEQQLLLITELVNFDYELREDLVAAFNKVTKFQGSDITLVLEEEK